MLVELKARFDEQAQHRLGQGTGAGGRPRRVRPRGAEDAHEDARSSCATRPTACAATATSAPATTTPTTARLYEDLGLLTCDPDIGADLTQLFNHLTGYSREVRYHKLLVAPRAGCATGIAGPDPQRGDGRRGTGRIIMKMNSLVDPEMIDALYDASPAGVEIDLIIRGICCLRPGVPGLSENIRVRSIVGRYLEHSPHLLLRQRRPAPAGRRTSSARPI